MNELDFSFDNSPWELFLSGKREGDRISAAHFLTLLEQETEDAVEDAFAALDDQKLMLDVSDLPVKQYTGQAALRLRQEAEIAEKAMDVSGLNPTDPLRLYLEEIREMPRQTDEKALADRVAQGDQRAAEQLMHQGLHRVVEIVPEFVGYGVLMMDLLQEGGLALWQAIQAPEGDYLTRRDRAIRAAMAKAVTLQARANGVGQKMRQALEDYRAVDERLLAELGRNATLEEIALELHMTPEDAETVRKVLEDARMLQQATAPKEEEASEEEQAVEDTAYFQMRQRISELLSVLPEEDAKLLTLRFGLEKGLPMSPEDTGKALGLTVDQVLRREAKALAMLREEKQIRRAAPRNEDRMGKKISVAIDGPAGAGKSTIARRLAGELGYRYVDTGAIYRTVAYFMDLWGVSPKDVDGVNRYIDELTIGIEYDDEGIQHMIMNGMDVTADIRTQEIGQKASLISAHAVVRDVLLDMQREMAEQYDVVMDGRDIGSVVLPKATVKIFLTASPEVRARRRYKELLEKGQKAKYEQVLKEVQQRDYQDTHREIAPLKMCRDSVKVDTSDMTFEESVAAIRKIIEEKLAK